MTNKVNHPVKKLLQLHFEFSIESPHDEQSESSNGVPSKVLSEQRTK